jgi:hypothetical protein
MERCSLFLPPRWGAGPMALMLWLNLVFDDVDDDQRQRLAAEPARAHTMCEQCSNGLWLLLLVLQLLLNDAQTLKTQQLTVRIGFNVYNHYLLHS